MSAVSAMVTSRSNAGTLKKKYLVPPRPLDIARRPIRLAALRSVALPQPRPRVRQAHRSPLAWPRTGRHLRLQHPRRKPDPPIAILRFKKPAFQSRPVGAEHPALGAVARGAAPHLSR